MLDKYGVGCEVAVDDRGGARMQVTVTNITVNGKRPQGRVSSGPPREVPEGSQPFHPSTCLKYRQAHVAVTSLIKVNNMSHYRVL